MTQIITSKGGGGGGKIDKYVVDAPYEEWEGEERAIAGDAVYEKVSAMETEIDGKQDVISDLETIRQGAAKGATAVQPNDNISELNNDAGYINKDVNDLTNYTKTTDLPDFTTYQLKSNMVTSLNSADNDHYPTAKAVKDAISSAGGGDVSGPSSSVDGHLAVFDGATGKLIKDGGAVPTPTTVVDNLNSTSATSALSANQGRVLNNSISTINGKIPSAATTTNQLADKNYVDNSINSVAAYYITKNAAGAQFATYAELAAATVFYSGGAIRTPTRNDYTIVLDDETHNDEVTRYIYNNGWEYQYTINESPLTQAQLDALDSGITSGKVTSYDSVVSTIATYGNIVTHNTSEFATSAQGSKADSALQPNDNISELNNDAGYITGVNWGDIGGTLSDQVDLSNALGAKANDNAVVKLTGAQTIDGTKTFSTSPVVPSKTTDATNTGTAIATEAQVYKKQDTLVSGTNIKTVNGGDILGAGNLFLHSYLQVTLTSAGRSSNTQTVTASGVTSGNAVIVSPDPSNIDDYVNSGVYCSSQGANSLTFTCDTTPSSNITVNVVILG